VPQTIRQYWWSVQGRTVLNLFWGAIDHDSVVLISVSEYTLNEPEPAASRRFVGDATISVDNISPYGPPYTFCHGVAYVVTVDWWKPLHIVADITVLDAKPVASLPPGLPWHRLGFQMQHQQQGNWCWAAVAASVSRFYNTASTWTQCLVANSELGRNDCCGAGGPGACNRYGYLDVALTQVGNFDHMIWSSATFASASGEIDGGRPLGLRVAWSGGGAHFLAIIGYLDDGEGYLAVDDPIYGKSDVSYATLKSNYQQTGSWTHSYYTKR
jgi:hypothetical protein